jgi:hypothetical protein
LQANLGALLNDAMTYDASLGSFRSACQKITVFYFVERYPFVMETGVMEEDVQSFLGRVHKTLTIF